MDQSRQLKHAQNFAWKLLEPSETSRRLTSICSVKAKQIKIIEECVRQLHCLVNIDKRSIRTNGTASKKNINKRTEITTAATTNVNADGQRLTGTRYKLCHHVLVIHGRILKRAKWVALVEIYLLL